MGVPILGNYFEEKNFKDIVIVSPDHGGVTRARKLADRLKAPIAIIDKRRPKPNVAEVMNIIGHIEGKTAILIDDIIDTAGTITLAANALRRKRRRGSVCMLYTSGSFRSGDRKNRQIPKLKSSL